MDIHVKDKRLLLWLAFHSNHAKLFAVPQIPGYSTLCTFAHTMTFMQIALRSLFVGYISFILQRPLRH